MDYPLENLDPERFQQLCQSLIAREYPQVQCFPVAQPDGGRDAVSFISDQDGTDKFMVFQVKFIRKPLAESDPHKWLLAIIEEEAPKVRKLIPRGATKYVLLTNIPGTAHSSSGSIDKLDQLLKEKLGISSTCWWRDDINRRLDNAWDLKWTYPELLTGPDFLRIIIESGLTEHKERRSAAIRAFLKTQYDLDEQVRFKQVELQNKLLDLFVDVPITLRDHLVSRKLFHSYRSVISRTRITNGSELEEGTDVELHETLFETSVRWHHGNEQQIGAATVLLGGPMQERMPHVVIEGAPGQGKSTITQYVCQVHRMRLLREQAAMTLVDPHHLSVPVRLPIRVDLRDFALWLGKKDPFNASSDDLAPTNWNKSLDSFLAGLISHQSGGTQFTVDDLLAVFRISAVLIVFDGLDEVADMTRRHEVVDEIVKGVQRLEANSASMQTVVTSRPAAFANSPGMPHSKYPHLQLMSLPRHLIMSYADRWLRARKLDSKQSAEFRLILKEKLDQPHLRDLARNPMQLAILLSLVLTRGASLPDKRTALYDYYIDLFFSREAEKSAVVRNHRDLLIDIHRHLAWILQSQSEKDNGRTSIRQEQLQQLVSDYLTREGHPSDLAKELFTGMIERVVALVSRVEGTFEFEVQPLQEYFAACHLYYTAPQSSPGKEMTGSKPDRFDAIARNFYWLNVTRFYAGCYSKGELPSLVERLQELAATPGFKIIGYPRTLAATLLSDWVFTQNPRSVQQVVELITNPDSLRYVLAPLENRRIRPGIQNPLVLPPRCGRDELIKRCFEELNADPPQDLTSQILELLKANAETASDVVDLWYKRVSTASHDDQPRWLQYGVQLGTLSLISLEQLHSLMQLEHLRSSPYVIGLLFRARRLDYLQSTEEIFESVVSFILDGKILIQPQRRIESPLDALGQAIDLHRYSSVLRDRQPLSLAQFWESRSRAAKLTWSPQITTATESFKSHGVCVAIAQVAERESQKSVLDWATDLEPWNAIIEAARNVWGERWSLIKLANVAAGIRSNTEKCSEFSNLLDRSAPLAKRVRFARLRSGAHRWWKAQVEAASNQDELMFVLLILFTWATPSTWLANCESLEAQLTALSEMEWQRLYSTVRRCTNLARSNDEHGEKLDSSKLPATMSLRFVALLSDRAHHADGKILYSRFIENTKSTDRIILGIVQREALDISHVGTNDWNPDLDTIKDLYKKDVAHEPFAFRRRFGSENAPMNITLAEKILVNPTYFPGFLVAAAEEKYRTHVASKVTAVAAVAEKEYWFSSPE
jgi:hypothetical protein